MASTIQELAAFGVPVTAGDCARPWDPAGVRSLLDATDLAALDTRERDALAAWMSALADHWPSRYASLGPAAPRLRASLVCSDRGRLVKLRRVARANLARVLV